jgi:hypothetical protein
MPSSAPTVMVCTGSAIVRDFSTIARLPRRYLCRENEISPRSFGGGRNAGYRNSRLRIAPAFRNGI